MSVSWQRYGWVAAAVASLVWSSACGGGKLAVAPGDGGPEGGSGSGSGGSTGSSGGTSSSGSGSSSGSRPPPTQTSKVDVLFMIDNSPSMGDKQTPLLATAVPRLVNELTQPRCVDGSGNFNGASAKPDGSGCPGGSKPEFAPVSDLHLGIVTSSLGSRGGDVCPDGTPNPVNPSLNAHDNDNGELVARTGVAGDPTVENAPPAAAGAPLNFLAYAPSGGSSNPPPEMSPAQLVADFTAMIDGVHEHGCGFEAQNEAWYRFLVQPDPYKTIPVPPLSNGGRAQLQGIDETILQQRAAFLRPDSVVVVVVVTDENEEAADPLSISGQGWAFNESSFPGSQSGGGAAEGTIECATNPNDPNCTSCAFNGSGGNPQRCPKEGANGNQGYMDPSLDAINLRFFHQKQRFGITSAYPTSRYVRGLQAATVPSVGLAFAGDTDHEHDMLGNYVGNQDAQANCVNPLFATNLPTSSSSDLCRLTAGPRSPAMVYYATIAGVPHQLLQQDPNNPSSPQKATLSAADWTRVLGKDPEHYDFSGADFHMIESPTPRTNNTGAWANVATCSPPASGRPSATQDPMNGCEYDTTLSGAVEDLQFACIFPLVTVDGSGTVQPLAKDCNAPQYVNACDCAGAALDNKSQLCDPSKPTTQLYGKAYPSLRELVIAKAMANATVNGQPSNQAVVSSLCPISLDIGQPVSAATADPLFGYNPAADAIVERIKPTLKP